MSSIVAVGRFAAAAFFGSIAGTAAILAVNTIFVLAVWSAPFLLNELPEAALYYSVVSLGFALVLGFVGLAKLRMTGSWSASWLVLAGVVLGLIAGVFIGRSLDAANPFPYMLSLAGAAIAPTFWYTYRALSKKQAAV